MLLDDFKTQEDVKIIGRFPGYDDFLGFDISNGVQLATASKRIYGEILNHIGRLLNIIYLSYESMGNYSKRSEKLQRWARKISLTRKNVAASS